MAQRFDERVDLDHHLAERIAASRAARPDREVAFAEGSEEVRQGLERQHDPFAEREGEAETDGHDRRSGSTAPWGVVARPEKSGI